MGKSARKLGETVGLNAQELNYALKEQGFLGGEPGERFVTEKGKPFAKELDFHRGNGGYSRYNKSWDETFWDPSILKELDLSAKHKQEIRDAVKEERRQRREEKAEASRAYWESIEQAKQSQKQDDMPESSSATILAFATGVVIPLLISVSPFVIAFWDDKVIPAYDRATDKLRRKKAKAKSPSNEKAL